MANIFQVQKCAKLEDMDRLSELPDAIVAHILSLLPMEDAARTSLVSKYWNGRWLFAFDEFDFSCSRLKNIKSKVLDESQARMNHSEAVPRGKFFEWVNMVLESHGRCHLEEGSGIISKLRFRVPFEMDDWYALNIDKCLSYAFSKRVRSLELNFQQSCRSPYQLRCPRRLVDETDISCLRSLTLSGVVVSREDVNSLLLKCPSLEDLKLYNASRFASLEICNSALALKHLEIVHWIGVLPIYLPLKSVILRDTRLASLVLPRVGNLVLENNSKLVSLSLSEGKALQTLSSFCLSRLHTLTLSLSWEKVGEVFDQVPKLGELKQLILIVDPMQKEILLVITTLLFLSPKLEKLVLEFVSSTNRIKKIPYKRSRRFPDLQHLKTVQVRGYEGRVYEDKLLKSILKHVAAPIKKVIFVPSLILHMSVEMRAEKLRKVVEMGVKGVRLGKKRAVSSPIEFITLS